MCVIVDGIEPGMMRFRRKDDGREKVEKILNPNLSVLKRGRANKFRYFLGKSGWGNPTHTDPDDPWRRNEFSDEYVDEE